MSETPPTRFYAYSDESGQDTKGRLFIVGTVVVRADTRDAILEQLEGLERRSQKGRVKWHRARHAYRQAYVTELTNLTFLQDSLFLARFTGIVSYHEATAEATARAIQTKAQDPYRVRVVVDGLRGKEKSRFGGILRRFAVRPDDVRGGRDQSDAFIRLADALCGLARDADDGQDWAVDALARLERRSVVLWL